MTYAITEAQDADAAYMPIWGPLLQFNEQAVGDASALPFALACAWAFHRLVDAPAQAWLKPRLAPRPSTAGGEPAHG